MGNWYRGRYRPRKYSRKSSGVGGSLVDLISVLILSLFVSRKK